MASPTKAAAFKYCIIFTRLFHGEIRCNKFLYGHYQETSVMKLFITICEWNSAEAKSLKELPEILSQREAEFPKGDILITDGPFAGSIYSTIHLLLTLASLLLGVVRSHTICLLSFYIKPISTNLPSYDWLRLPAQRLAEYRPKSETTDDRD